MTVNDAVFVVPACAAEIVVAPDVETTNDAIPKLAIVCPAGTVTDAGTVARAGTELVSVTTAPPAGAAAFNVTFPVAPWPPRTLVRFSVSERRSGWAVRLTVFVTPACAAEIVTILLAVTTAVVTANAAEEAPAGTVKLAGTVAAVSLLVSVIAAPPAGAAAFKVTVPVAGFPPMTVAGLTETESSRGLTVSVAVFVTPA